MKNVVLEVDGDELVIRVNLTQRHGKSQSGKTTIVASTEGNQSLEDAGFPDIRVGVNVYTK